MIARLAALLAVAAGAIIAAQPVPASAPAASSSATPVTASSNSEADRLPPPDVKPVVRAGVRYAQATDGHAVGASQARGVLVATDAASGKQLWGLVVYPNPIDPKLEADVQWIFFHSMAFDPDGRLRIRDEAGKTWLVDVRRHVSTPAP